MRLQLPHYRLGTREVHRLCIAVLARIDDLAMVDGDGVAGGALAEGPADAAAEFGIGVGGEDLPSREEAAW